MNEMNFYTLNGEQYEIADKANREAVAKANQEIAKKAGQDYLDQNFASSIPVIMAGAAVSTDMVSPIEHEVGCKVESKNLVNLMNIKSSELTQRSDSIKVHKGIYYFNVFKESGEQDVSLTNNCAVRLRDSNKKMVAEFKEGMVTLTEAQAEKITNYYFYYSGTYSGSPTIKAQITFEENTKTFIPYNLDLSVVTVYRNGKNLFPYPYKDTTKTQNGVTFTDNGNGSITIRTGASGATNKVSFKLTNEPLLMRPLVGETYSLSGCSKIGKTDPYLIVQSYKTWKNNFISGGTLDTSVTSTTQVITETLGYYSSIFVPKGFISTEGYTVYPMFCKGEVQPFEPLDSQRLNPNSEGVVAGMKSVPHDMSIVTDNPNVTIEATYNAETKKYIDKKFAELQAAILSTGGNV